MHVEAVGTVAGLAGVAHFGVDGGGGGGFEVGVIEDDEGGVAAEFEGEAGDVLGGLLDEEFADAGGAGERDFSDEGIGEEFGDEGRGVSGEELKDAGGEVGGAEDRVDGLREGDAAEGGDFRGFQDHGAAGGEGGGDFADGEHEREIPGGDGGGWADGLADDEGAFLGVVMRDDAAVGAGGFLGEPADLGDGEGDFALGLGDGFAVLAGDEGGEIGGVLFNVGGDGEEDVGAVSGGECAPGGPGVVGSGDGLSGVIARGVGDFGEGGTECGVGDGEGLVEGLELALEVDGMGVGEVIELDGGQGHGRLLNDGLGRG